ncbi:MAG: sugar phosphate isomerase/epimerase family protein [Bryobacteraceae bacterium]|nr:sugar phosphate isomerase/epimerase family protein [Bryobacteraceae bacterium]
MQPLEIGVIFWAGSDPAAQLAEAKSLGARCGQLGVPGDYALEGAAEKWKAALAAADFPIVSVVGAYNGEDYADIPTVQRTCGYVPESTRDERLKRTYALSDLAAAIGAPGIGAHVGFVPEDPSDPAYIAARDAVRAICDYAAKHGQTFNLETGQEPAPVLLEFLRDVARPNVRINFDPANMILYGTGDPIEAFGILAPHVISVHCKDGDWPPKDKAGALGTEKPLGQGSVGMDRFIAKVKECGYRGPLIIEREGSAQWAADVRAGAQLLQRLLA